MFRKNHVSWTLVRLQFINNFLIRLTGFISCSRLLKFVNVHIIIGQIIGPAVAGSAGPVPTPMNLIARGYIRGDFPSQSLDKQTGTI